MKSSENAQKSFSVQIEFRSQQSFSKANQSSFLRNVSHIESEKINPKRLRTDELLNQKANQVKFQYHSVKERKFQWNWKCLRSGKFKIVFRRISRVKSEVNRAESSEKHQIRSKLTNLSSEQSGNSWKISNRTDFEERKNLKNSISSDSENDRESEENSLNSMRKPKIRREKRAETV